MAEQHGQGFYDARDGRGWQKCDEGVSVETSKRRDHQAWHEEAERRAQAALARTRFVVGQVISTEEEYEALPVEATVWPLRPDVKDPWHWVRTKRGYVANGQIGCVHGIHSPFEMSSMDYTIPGPGTPRGRVIRSLPETP